MIVHDRTDEYLEGTLGPDEEAAFLDHLVGCAVCQAALTDNLQLRDREALARESSAGTVVPPNTQITPPVVPTPATAPPAPDSATVDPPAKVARLALVPVPVIALVPAPAGPSAGSPTPVETPPTPDPEEVSPAPAVPGLIRIWSRLRQPSFAIPLAAVVAAAAAALMWLGIRRPPAAEPTLALARTRSIETRIGHPAAAGHRDYDVPRGKAGDEGISSEAIAAFERSEDCRGSAAAHVLNGDLDRADKTYVKCDASPALDADRAGLAVLLHRPEEALRFADRALIAHPDLSVALWNRALALRDLGLDLAAAADFDRVARLDAALDPAWTKEAMARRDALYGPSIAMRDSWNRTLKRGTDMATGGPPIPTDLAQRNPARARAFLHHAIRTARTHARLDELRPLAATLEGLAGTGLARYIDQAAAGLTPARIALIDDYTTMFHKRAAPDDTQFLAWLDRARVAGADDLVLGALDVTGQIADHAVEATHLAEATHDPWFELAVVTARASNAREAHRFDEAAALLDEGKRRCPAGAPEFRCVALILECAQLENDRYHPAVARDLSTRALREATKLGEWRQRMQAANLAGEAERFRDEFAAARAFYREYALGDDEDDDPCLAHRRTAAFSAEMSFDEHRIRDAHEAAAGLPTCGTPPELQELVLEANLLRAGTPVRDRAALLAALAAARGPADDTDRRYIDYLAARAELGQVADAPARLRAIVADARARPADTAAARAGAGAAAAAIVDAGTREAWSEVLEIAAEARGVEVPRRCAIVVAADDFQLVGAAVGPSGEVVGVHLHDIARPTEWLAPQSLRDHIRGCDLVDVLAAPTWLGVEPLLDPAVAWRYVLGPRRAPTQGEPHRVIIADPKPPTSLGLPNLAPWTTAPSGTELITGTAATPERLASAARDATIVEIHAHTDRVAGSDAPALALSPGRTGWAVTAEMVREMRLDRAPVIVLADCSGAVPARYAHTSWGLPAGFLGAGAHAVIAALAPIPDTAATVFFAEVVADLERGLPAATAVARARAAAIARDPKSWALHIVVFE